MKYNIGFFSHPSLLRQVLQREISGRYRGAQLGWVWSVLHPLIMLSVYTLVFGTVLKSRWPGAGAVGTVDFAFILFAGLVPFNLIAEVFGRSTSLICGNVNYVKKVVFPLHVLSAASVLAAAFHGVISIGILIAVRFVMSGELNASVLALPLIWLPLMLILYGCALFLSGLTVYFRDLSQIMSVITTILMFLTPIFYPASSLPSWIQPWIVMNPFVWIVESTRLAVFFGTWPDLHMAIIYLVASYTFAWLSKRIFEVIQKGFADVL